MNKTLLRGIFVMGATVGWVQSATGALHGRLNG